MKKILLLAIIVFGFSQNCFAGEVVTFESFYVPSHTIGWILAGVGALIAGAVVFFTGGTASPIVVSIGTALGNAMGYAGAVATNVGLATLGGGAVAAGGLGMAGGAALLTVALTFSTEIVIDYGCTTAFHAYDQHKFIEASRTMATLPWPKNDDGPDPYENAFERLEKLQENEDEENSFLQVEQLKDIRKELLMGDLKNCDAEDSSRIYCLAGLISYKLLDFESAEDYSARAISFARKAELRRTLPAFIYAASKMRADNYNFRDVTKNYFRYAVLAEPDNELIPLMYSIYLSKMVYRSQDGFIAPTDFDLLLNISNEESLEDFQEAILIQIVASCFKVLKIYQQQILSVSQSRSNVVRSNPEAKAFVENSFLKYKAILQTTEIALDRLANCDESILDEDKISELADVLVLYKNDVNRLDSIVERFDNETEEYNSLTFNTEN